MHKKCLFSIRNIKKYHFVVMDYHKYVKIKLGALLLCSFVMRRRENNYGKISLIKPPV
jgi:hypothetical protein